MKFQHMEFENPIAKFDLTLTASESAGRLHFTFQYATSLFKEETIQRMAGHLKNLVSSAAANPSVAIGNMEMLSAEEKRRILVDFNDTASDYPESKTIIDIFNRQVESTPENIAVKGADLQGGETSISYRDLHRQSSALACALAGKGLGPGKVGAVMSGQTVEMIPVILALLKTGAAYVPIDPRYPADRIGYILEDSNAAVFLTSREAAENITYEKEIIYLEEIENLEAAEASLPVTDPSAPAYIIYTSGSTGRPKGVITGHRALVNLCWWNRAYYHLLESDRMSKYVGFGFDVSLWEIFPTLSVGACLCIVPENIRLDVRKLNEFYESEGITLSFLPPQIAEQFMAEEDNRSLRYLQVGGDKLREYVPRNYQVVNNYGPTEYTVIATIFPVDCPHANIPIGKPLANTSLYVLDKTQKVQPVGVPGELYISGDGLAMGYLNRPDLTAGAFVPNPFQPGERMYKTGDLAAWLPDGNIQYLGRLDFQVKIRGFRIELGEIETAILGHQSVKDAVVITREETPGNFYLCAYVVPTGVPDWSEFIPLLRETLARSLPDYMIPAYFVRMDVLPLNAAGKVNRRFLPEPQDSEHAATGVEFLAPRDETEQKLADIYGDLLRVKQVGIDDDFFRMGGHSLKATQLVGHIHKSLNVSLSLTEVFKSPTVRGLAQKVNELSALPRKGEFAAIEKTPQQEYYPLSAIQRRMYLAQVTAPGNTSYNLPMVTELVGRLDRELLTDVLQQLVNRHESFRTSFLTVDALPKQKIIPRVRMEVEYFDPAKTGTGKAEEIVEIFETFIRPFDMLEPPHIRAGLVKREEERHILMLDMHHIISDGSSLNVLFEEFMTLYDGKSLPPPKLQYKDFVYWQESEARQVEIKKQALYWLQLYRKTPQVLQLPLDFPRPKIKGFKGLHHYFYMDRDTTDKITALAKEEGSTLFMVLLGLYNVLLSKLTGLEDIVVGTSIAGRRHTDLQPIVGMFVNALALRNFPSGDKTFLQFIKELRDNTLAAFENQDYSFEELVDFVGGSRDPGRNPIFDTMFILNNEEDIEEFRIPGLILKGCEEFRHTTAQMDIKFRVRETEQGLTMAYEYSTALFKPETMEMFAANFNEVAAAVLESPEVLLSDIRITHGLQEVKVDISDISFDF
ncbi:MAG: amino acid adenylation domain-containing protein [bacterium]|nr:amino acid adenylation domain-containing protein [bacterium]